MNIPKFGLSNWFKNNTPLFWQITGDIALVAASISGTLAAVPASLQAAGIPFHWPPVFDKITTYCLGIGVIYKLISKLFGKKEVVTDTQNS